MRKCSAESNRNRGSTEDYALLGRPKTSTTDEQVDTINRMVWDGRRLTVQQRVMSIGISSGLVHTVITDILAMQDGNQG